MIERFRYDTDAIELRLIDSDGDPMNVTDETFVLTIDGRKTPPPGDTATEIASITAALDNAALGYISFSPSAAQADIAPRRYYYQIRRTVSASRGVKTLRAGEYLVRPTIPA